jgi:uncharacterized phage protein (TIGR01671 family)
MYNQTNKTNMNREIKFRAFDSVAEKMLYLLNSDMFDTNWLNDVSIMQYTGLKDKNGKKIYEGDILNIGFGGDASMVYHTHNYCVVFWCDKNLQWKTKYNKGDNPLTGYYLPVYEIIGNIYENPELLK